MEEVFRGRLSRNTNLENLIKHKDTIIKKLVSGVLLADIIKQYKTSSGTLHKLFKKERPPKVDLIINHKLEPYYETEDEIMQSLKQKYTWKSLSKHEKEFYKNYGKERDNQNDTPLE